MSACVEEERHDVASARMLRALLKDPAHLIALLGADSSIVDISESVKYLLGFERSEMIGRNAFDLLTPERREFMQRFMAHSLEHGRQSGDAPREAELPGEFEMKTADGGTAYLELLGSSFFDDPEIAGRLVVGRRVSYLQVLTDALAVLAYEPDELQSMRRMLTFLELKLPDTCAAVSVGDSGQDWVFVQEDLAALCTTSGPWNDALAAGELALAMVDAPGGDPVTTNRLRDRVLAPELRAPAADLGFRACWCLPLPNLRPRLYARFAPGGESQLAGAALAQSPPAGDPGEGSDALGCLVLWSRHALEPDASALATVERVGLFMEIALRRRADRERIRRLLHHDQLTGALSRTGLDAVLAGAPALPTQVLIDLDDFKRVNDRFGHAVGDQLLRLAAQRIIGAFRAEDQVVRLGGDEFLVLSSTTQPELAGSMVERLLEAFARPFRIGELSLLVAVSAGIAVAHEDEHFDQVTDRADRAMYHAKRGGKHGWAMWTPDLDPPAGPRTFAIQ